tara:strand:- start:265 stop:630 length:366 start_codon:yes stop_codon:yes gene_type:complete
MLELSFGKKQRLLSARAFQVVFDNTHLKVSHTSFLLLAHRNRLTHSRLGVIVAKKNMRLSVERNRVKRVVRSSFRLNQQNLASLDIIFLVRKGMNKILPKDQTGVVLGGFSQLQNKMQNFL